MSLKDDISGFTINYTNPGTGLNLPDAWVQVRMIRFMPDYSCMIRCDIFQNEQSFLNGSSPIFANIDNEVFAGYPDNFWADYFSPTVMAQADHDPQTQAIKYLQQHING